MQTNLADFIRNTPDGDEADAILRKCVHCGFCTATCPTYQLLGDELDGPRGRIYLIKQMVEGAPVTRSTQQHLDRCLTCRSCETTCPSGVQYGRLVEIGRKHVEAQVHRPVQQRLVRYAEETLSRGQELRMVRDGDVRVMAACVIGAVKEVLNQYITGLRTRAELTAFPGEMLLTLLTGIAAEHVRTETKAA